MNINNSLNNLQNMNSIKPNKNDSKNISKEFLNKTEEKNNEIISSILENRKQNVKSFTSEVGNRNIQNLNTALDASYNSLDKATVILKNLKALYLNINTKNFSFEKISNLSEKTSIVIKQLKFIAKNTTLDDTPLLSGKTQEFNVYIKNKSQTLKLSFVSLLKIASTIEDIKITNMNSLKEGASVINKSLEDIAKSIKKIESMKSDVSSILDYYDKNSSKIKNSKDAMSLLLSIKNSLLGKEENKKSSLSIFKNIISKSDENVQSQIKEILVDENLSDTNILSKENLEQKIRDALSKTEIIDDTNDNLVSDDDIKRASEALKNVQVYDDEEENKEFKFEDLSKFIDKDKEVKKENIFTQFDENEIENKKINEDEKKNDEIDENLVALLNGKNFFKNKSKFIWTSVVVLATVTFFILIFSMINK